jgi:hypothetical protein
MIEKVDISQADYNALEVKDPNTVYCIPPEKVQKGLIDNKQIEEMAKIAEEAIDNQTVGNCPFSPCPYKGSSICCDTCHTINALYNAGYRKQSEGEWIQHQPYHQTDDFYCSLCGAIAPVDCLKEDFYESNFCPNCGASMKGGAE